MFKALGLIPFVPEDGDHQAIPFSTQFFHNGFEDGNSPGFDDGDDDGGGGGLFYCSWNRR